MRVLAEAPTVGTRTGDSCCITWLTRDQLAGLLADLQLLVDILDERADLENPLLEALDLAFDVLGHGRWRVAQPNRPVT